MADVFRFLSNINMVPYLGGMNILYQRSCKYIYTEVLMPTFST